MSENSFKQLLMPLIPVVIGCILASHLQAQIEEIDTRLAGDTSLLGKWESITSGISAQIFFSDSDKAFINTPQKKQQNIFYEIDKV